MKHNRKIDPDEAWEFTGDQWVRPQPATNRAAPLRPASTSPTGVNPWLVIVLIIAAPVMLPMLYQWLKS